MFDWNGNSICILIPISEAPEFTPDELLAKEARTGLGKQLVGNWSFDGKRPEPYQPPAAEESEDEVVLVSSDEDDPFLSKLMEFNEDGKLQTHTSELKWECVRQDGKRLMIAMLMNGSPYDLQVDFDGSDEISVSVVLGDAVYSTKKYRRIVEEDRPVEVKKTGGDE